MYKIIRIYVEPQVIYFLFGFPYKLETINIWFYNECLGIIQNPSRFKLLVYVDMGYVVINVQTKFRYVI